MNTLNRLLVSTICLLYCLFPTLKAQPDPQIGRVEYSIVLIGQKPNLNCDPRVLGIPVKKHGMTVKNLSTQTQTVIETDADGFYHVAAATDALMNVKPDVLTITNMRSALITTWDIVLMNNHISRTEGGKITCPYARIAADVTNDGKIDAADAEAISQYIIGTTPNLGNVPMVRFISKAYTVPNYKHPDQQFIADFWNPDYTDEDGEEYPFNAEIFYNNKIYDYNGAKSWVGQLNEWRFSDGVCESADWGFVAVVSGDIDVAQTPTTLNAPMPALATTPVTSEKVQINVLNTISTISDSTILRNGPLSNSYYKVTVLATTQEPVTAFQLQVNTNNERIKISDITNGGEQMTTDLSKNMNQSAEMLKLGQLKMLWVSKMGGNTAPFTMSQTPLFSFIAGADNVVIWKIWA